MLNLHFSESSQPYNAPDTSNGAKYNESTPRKVTWNYENINDLKNINNTDILIWIGTEMPENIYDPAMRFHSFTTSSSMEVNICRVLSVINIIIENSDLDICVCGNENEPFVGAVKTLLQYIDGMSYREILTAYRRKNFVVNVNELRLVSRAVSSGCMDIYCVK